MRRSVLTVGALVAVCAATVIAQKTTEIHPGKGGSPHVRSEWTVDGAAITIEYGRPSLKGRPEAQLMPPGKPWRTGADEATTLRTDKALTFGTLSVPAGTYRLYTIPGDGEWTLAISTRADGWGIPVPVDADLGRVPMAVGKTPAHVEQLTISIDDTPAGATLKVEWGMTSASVAFTVS